MYAQPIRQLIQALKRLPGVGPRTAERFVFSLLHRGKKDVGELLVALKQVMDTIKSCERCYTFSDSSPCEVCRDQTRGQDILCVVATPQDREAIEKTKAYRGLYHILRGTIDTTDEQQQAQLKLPELFDRLQKETIREVILALNPDMQGESTMIYISGKIKQGSPQIKVTRLARGLPMGSDVQYADDITLQSAFENRR